MGREIFASRPNLFEGAIGADIHAPIAPVAALDVLGKADTIPVRVLEKILTELLLRRRLFQVVGAPLVVGAEQVGRLADFSGSTRT